MPKTATRPCGYCQTGNHDQCPTAVRNGNGQPVVCPCGCWATKPRCLDCKNNVPGTVDSAAFLCLDREWCAEIQRRRREASPIYQFMQAREQREAEAPLQDADTPSRPPAGSRPTSGVCRCCGGATKGGKFLPGHDSRFIARLVGEVKDLVDAGDRAEEIADAKRRVLAELDDTPALRAKLERKLS